MSDGPTPYPAHAGLSPKSRRPDHRRGRGLYPLPALPSSQSETPYQPYPRSLALFPLSSRDPCFRLPNGPRNPGPGAWEPSGATISLQGIPIPALGRRGSPDPFLEGRAGGTSISAFERPVSGGYQVFQIGIHTRGYSRSESWQEQGLLDHTPLPRSAGPSQISSLRPAIPLQ